MSAPKVCAKISKISGTAVSKSLASIGVWATAGAVAQTTFGLLTRRHDLHHGTDAKHDSVSIFEGTITDEPIANRPWMADHFTPQLHVVYRCAGARTCW